MLESKIDVPIGTVVRYNHKIGVCTAHRLDQYPPVCEKCIMQTRCDTNEESVMACMCYDRVDSQCVYFREV